MAFLIRTIDFTAAGREIVRERTVAEDRIGVGRSTENAIHLPDLAVEQEHVTITRLGPDALKVEAVGTLGFGLNGRTAHSETVDPREGAEIELGSALLAIAREADGATSITIRQAESTEGKGDALAGFQLASALPSKRAMSWTFAGAILLLLLSIPVVTHLTRTPVENDPESDAPGQVMFDAAWSSGELSLAHHDLEDNCEACHVTPFVSVQDETCLTCHEELGDHAKMPRLAAGMPPLSQGDAIQWDIAMTLGKEGPLGCVSCHSEHEGPVKLEAASEQFCADCHSDLDTRLTDVSFANAHDFGKQHPQFRPTFYTQLGAEEPARVSLARSPVERSGLKFPHDVHMDKQGGAARMALSLPEYGAPLECADCHEEGPEGVGFKEVEMEDSCESCHSLVFARTASGFRSLRHGDLDDFREDMATLARSPRPELGGGRQRPGPFARGGAYYADFGRPVRSLISVNNALGKGGICAECHIRTTTDGRADLVPVNLPDRFLMHGFFSHKAHEDEKCTDCHEAATSEAATDLLIPDLESCQDCHKGASAVKTKEIVPSSCAMCHGYHTPTMPWKPEDHPETPEMPRDNLAARLGGIRK
ncbi:cytochrome c3 family protein [Erythrobacter sp.]|uniref:cytochrome c3 family protein n=1 Tax=Erythrobacter sp. TaxID=1042 RepID=UPI001425D396|nr:cytochrome c3 family protein [Erythrobacter sp.]QIQ85386.1 MAG: cytochrome c family protein [Erythrobacter sp.]